MLVPTNWRPLFCFSSQLISGLKSSITARVEMSSPVASFKTLRQSSYFRPSKRWLGQFAISGPGLRMFIGEPQKHKAHNRHYYVHWQNQSHVSRRKIVRRDHLINVTAGGAP